MLEIKYTSKNGTVTLGGGSHSLFRIRSITGIGMPQREYSSIATTGYSGQREIGRRDNARYITIGCDSMRSYSIDNLSRVIYEDGELTLTVGVIVRKIKCKFYAMSDLERKTPCGICSFSLQFVADDPYFYDESDTVIDICGQINEVTSTFTLPCVFSSSSNSATVNVNGIKNIYPTIIIGCTEAGEESTTYGITITNITTGHSLTLRNRMEQDELITINLKERTIKSNKKGNVINTLSETSDMEKMYLTPGNNTMTVDSLSSAETNNVQLIYRSEYITAEY